MREQIVSNGCSGNCCEKFTLPVTLRDIRMMKLSFIEQRLEANEKEIDIDNIELKKVLCDNGYLRYSVYEEDVDKLLDMLIPLGYSEICPQQEISFNTLYFTYIQKYDTDEEIREALNNFPKVSNGHIVENTFTCKHFDKTNKVCTNYENRPWLCKDFGRSCNYTGCSFVKNIEHKNEQQKIANSIEDISQEDGYYLGYEDDQILVSW
jgi:Fe-S-cluster containining protein